MPRYAAKLLFIWHPDPLTDKLDRRLCEERIVLFRSRSAAYAVKRARMIGKESQLRYPSGHQLRFAGVLECMEMEEILHEPGEVWYEMRRRQNPDRWAKRAIPSESSLSVFANHESKSRRSANKPLQPTKTRSLRRLFQRSPARGR